MLPILLVEDWVSAWAFRGDYPVRNLLIPAPSAMIGIAVGYLIAARVGEVAVRFYWADPWRSRSLSELRWPMTRF